MDKGTLHRCGALSLFFLYVHILQPQSFSLRKVVQKPCPSCPPVHSLLPHPREEARKYHPPCPALHDDNGNQSILPSMKMTNTCISRAPSCKSAQEPGKCCRPEVTCGSTICSRGRLGPTQMSINRELVQWIMKYLCGGMLASCLKNEDIIYMLIWGHC